MMTIVWSLEPTNGFQLSSAAGHASLQPQRRTDLRVSSTLQFNESVDLLETNLAGVSPPFPRMQAEPVLPEPTMDTSKSRTANVVELISTTSDLANFIRGNPEENDLVVVKYYAHYCKICQRAGMQYKKIATEYPNLSFGKVESMVFPDSANTLRSLGVSKFPFVQIFRNGQCVASFSTGPSHLFVKRVRDTIDTCLRRTPDEWNSFLSDFATEIESNRRAREEHLPHS